MVDFALGVAALACLYKNVLPRLRKRCVFFIIGAVFLIYFACMAYNFSVSVYSEFSRRIPPPHPPPPAATAADLSRTQIPLS